MSATLHIKVVIPIYSTKITKSFQAFSKKNSGNFSEPFLVLLATVLYYTDLHFKRQVLFLFLKFIAFFQLKLGDNFIHLALPCLLYRFQDEETTRQLLSIV